MKNLIFAITEEEGRFAEINKLSIKNIKDIAHVICILDDAKKTLMEQWRKGKIKAVVDKKTTE